MAFDPGDFEELADWLAVQRADEAGLRTSISRLYYAAHLAATRGAYAKGWFTPTGGGKDHGGVIRALTNRGLRDRAGQLRKLLELREHADYHLDCAVGEFNRGCDICEEIRQSAGSKAVELKHWQDASEIGSRFLPLIRKL
jgi:hypothetical protein